MSVANYMAGNTTAIAPRLAQERIWTARSGIEALGARFSLISDLATLASLADRWRALEAAGAGSHKVFQSFDWCSVWSRLYAGEASRIELAVICGYLDDRLVLIWPLMREKSSGFDVLRWLSDPFGQYGDVLLAPGHEAKPWLRAAWRFLRKLKGAGTIMLRHVRADATVYPFLLETFRSARSDDAAPFMDLTPFPDEATYERRYSKEQRKRRRNIRKELEAGGPVEFTLLRPGSDMDRAMRRALREKHKWLSDRGLFSYALNCPKLLQFLKELSRVRPGESCLVTSLLTAGGKPISWEIGLRFKDRHCGFITAHDASLTDRSPARLHMDLSQRRAIADGMRIFDLMVPNDPHKESWSNGAQPVYDFYAPLSLAGLLHGRVYLEAIRPLLRYIYYHAPGRFRRLLTAANAGGFLR